jgi:AcrR family transcriptional regulator
VRLDCGTVPFVVPKSTARPLPGRQQLPREFIIRHQRARIIDALAEEISEKGYRGVTVADVVKRAAIARNTFYENFRSKEDCFLAAQETAMSAALDRVVTAGGQLGNWPQQVRAGLAAFLEYIAAEPALARACLVESLSAGPRAVEYYEESQQAFVSLFRLGRDVSPHGRDLPETLEEAIIGGVYWIVYQRLAVSNTDAVAELLPEIVEFALTPYLGPETAREIAAGDISDEKAQR